MTQKFCTACGSPLTPGNRFCGECGTRTGPLAQPEGDHLPAAIANQPAPGAAGSGQIAGIIPFVELSTGFTSSVEGTFIVTDRRIIFARTPASFQKLMKDTGNAIRTEVETALGSGLGSSPAEQRRYLNARDWSMGPWQRYASMSPETIENESPGNLSFLFAEIGSADFINAKGSNIYDSVDILARGKKFEFTVYFAQGPVSLVCFQNVLGNRAKDLMATWGTVDTVATLLGGKRH